MDNRINEKGDLDVVTCNSVLLTIDVFDRKMESTDTLRFQYTEFDSHEIGQRCWSYPMAI